SDLERLVAAAAEAARVGGLAVPRRPWPEELPGHLVLSDLAGAATARVGAGAAFGLADDPDRQRRALMAWTPTLGNLCVCGVAGSGATTVLASAAVSLARTFPPDRLWFYALDFGTQALAPLAGLPGCGAVVGSSDRERQFRLVRFLTEELERRRRHVAASGAVRIDPADPSSPFPTIVVLVDNYGGLTSAWEDSVGSSMRDILVRVIADGPGLGVVFALSADRPLSFPGPVSSAVPNKIALRLAEEGDYAFFGLHPRDVGKLGVGRGVDAGTKLEFQVALPHPDGLAAAVAETAAAGQVDASVLPPALGTLPDDVGAGLLVDSVRVETHEWFLPLGIGDLTLGPAGLRLLEGEHAFISGPPRSGKSTVLDALASVVGKARPDVVITAVALRRSPLRDAPEVTRKVTAEDQLAEALDAVLADVGHAQLVLIDDADRLEDTTGKIAEVVGSARTDVRVVAAARPDPLRQNYSHWTIKVRQPRQGLLLRPNLDSDHNLFPGSVTLPRGGPTTFEAGRGYLVAEGQAQLLQAAHRS
ncbi:MAG: FtsK/SpoIIIE domain-containing protein, partial [Acidimicrobiia bacterium]